MKLILINEKDVDYPDDTVNTKVHPHMTVTGTVTGFNVDDRSFTTTPTQYTVLQHMPSAFPIHASFADLDSRRWGEGGPKVAVGSTISFSGLLKRVVRDVDQSLSFVEIEVCSIAYLSNPNALSGMHYFPVGKNLDLNFYFSRVFCSRFKFSKAVELR